jgi:hypothetical protein
MKTIIALTPLFLCGCGPQAAGPSNQGGIISNVQNKVTTVQVQEYLRNIAVSYLAASVGGSPPRNMEELGVEGRWQKSPRDKEPFEIIYGVNTSQQDAGKFLLAWEKTADKDGGRCVLMADCKTIGYLKDEEFKNTPRAKGK